MYQLPALNILGKSQLHNIDYSHDVVLLTSKNQLLYLAKKIILHGLCGEDIFTFLKLKVG